MPSNIFIYQLPVKTTVSPSDRLIVEDTSTYSVALSSLGSSVFSEGVNFRIKNGTVLQIKETQGANTGQYKTVILYNGTLALSGAYEV
jgi:hypothetical protein